MHGKFAKWVCHICSFKSEKEDDYREHVQLHRNAEKGQCVICNKISKSDSRMRKHMQIHVNIIIHDNQPK